jgi:UDP-2,4-diacetamido-2,4,6-trideoxy-beta-L-altropyranose hydrolase
MKVFIITEGGKNIGFGHITRCLSLYQSFKERGILPKFIINGDDNIEYLLKNVNYQIFNWLDERNKLFEIIKDADIAVIDSYLADISLYNKIANLVKIPVYVDDNKRLDYPDGVVLNGNIHAETLNYPKKDGIIYLLGTKYTHLRKEFWEVPEKKIKEKIESIMVTFGGSDAKNMTPKILAFLNDKYQNLIKNVIIGKAFQNIDEIKKYTDKNTNLIYYPDAEKMREIMLESDIAISAGGQTLNELASVGVPTIGVCIAENQLGNVKGWEKVGFLEYVGWYNKSNILEKIENSIKYLGKIKLRKSKSKIGREFVDGKSSLRIIDEITKNSL